MGLKLNTASSGSVTIEPTNTASNYTLTVPATNATLAINGPAFSAYMTNASANQSVSSGTWTKVKIDTENFDTNGNYDSSTNYRFQPTVAGFYQISASIALTGSSASLYLGAIYKNGSIVGGAVQLQGVAGTATQIFQLSQLQYLNGSTEYIELYGLIVATSPSFVFGANNCTFSASMVRAA